jgi:transcriptional regulator
MYLPSHFREERTPVLHALMRAHPLATLITVDDRGPVANHIPMEIDPGAGELGVLRGHVARGNPLWKTHRSGTEALAVFAGPHAYVTPAHYATKAATGKVVPTWNYAAVHAWGPLQVIDDAAWLRRFVEQLTDRHEAARTNGAPWRVDDAPADYIDGLCKAIVGVEIPITRVEGKWKVSQNRPAEDRAGVASGLAESDDAMQRAMAALVAERS